MVFRHVDRDSSREVASMTTNWACKVQYQQSRVCTSLVEFQCTSVPVCTNNIHAYKKCLRLLSVSLSTQLLSFGVDLTKYGTSRIAHVWQRRLYGWFLTESPGR